MRLNPIRIATILLVFLWFMPIFQAEAQQVRTVTPGEGITFLPHCVNGVHWGNTNCEFQGSVTADEVWSIEVDYTQGSTSSYRYAQVTRAETGEDNVTYEIWLSATPNSPPLGNLCTSTSKITTAYEGAGISTACPVPLAKVFLNVKPISAAAGPIEGCGYALTCRPKLTGSFIYN